MSDSTRLSLWTGPRFVAGSALVRFLPRNVEALQSMGVLERIAVGVETAKAEVVSAIHEVGEMVASAVQGLRPAEPMGTLRSAGAPAPISGGRGSGGGGASVVIYQTFSFPGGAAASSQQIEEAARSGGLKGVNEGLGRIARRDSRLALG